MARTSVWGTLAAWGWGVGRLIDYLEADPGVDASRIGVTGHSRFGKAALVAMAYDPRIAIAFPSCAGRLGTKMNRRHGGQDLEHSAWERECHWVAGHFFTWMGPLQEGAYLPRRIALCPGDAYSLLALCAPRSGFLHAGTEDAWTDPHGIFLTGRAASPIYRLLGGKGLVCLHAKPLPRLRLSRRRGRIPSPPWRPHRWSRLALLFCFRLPASFRYPCLGTGLSEASAPDGRACPIVYGPGHVEHGLACLDVSDPRLKVKPRRGRGAGTVHLSLKRRRVERPGGEAFLTVVSEGRAFDILKVGWTPDPDGR